MPAATALSTRREIVQRHQRGEKFKTIADELRVSYGTVRTIWRQFEQHGHVNPAYERCRHTAIRKPQAICEQGVALKRAHPGWGAGLIRLELADQFAASELPSQRTLQRWFRQVGLSPSTAERRARTKVQRGQYPHEVWALDAKEDIQLADGSYISWLIITDEASGAILTAVVFPHSTVGHSQSVSGQSGSRGQHDALGTA
jgi:transposase